MIDHVRVTWVAVQIEHLGAGLLFLQGAFRAEA